MPDGALMGTPLRAIRTTVVHKLPIQTLFFISIVYYHTRVMLAMLFYI
jgi:hypothetical protein